MTTRQDGIALDMVGAVFQARAQAAEQRELQVAVTCRQLAAENDRLKAELAAFKASIEEQESGGDGR